MILIHMTIYPSANACSQATGVSKQILRIARSKGAPGFPKSGSSRIVWDELAPWIEEHKDEIEDLVGYTLEDLKKAKLAEEIENTRLQNQKLKGEYLDPTEVRQWLLAVGTAQASLCKQWGASLSPKLVGQSQAQIEATINASISELFTMFKTQLAKLA